MRATAVLSLSVLCELTAPALAQYDPILPQVNLDDFEQLAVHPRSRMRGMATSRDAEWIYISEGGMLTVIKSTDDFGQYAEEGFREPFGHKQSSMGEYGVLASRMMLDPEADDDPGPNVPGVLPKNLLYVAGGRDGLWVVEADVTPGNPTRAWRIDDSGNTNPATQNSRRWCADVDVVTVQGVDYLVAVFGKKSGSRLRFYELDVVRDRADVANGWPEMGGGVELVADLQVSLRDHPFPPNDYPETYGRSVAVSMGVDVDRSTPGQETADVYVAMVHHGIARVRVADIASPVVTWGPVFGDGTWYFTDPGHGALYGHATLEQNEDWIDPSNTPEIHRREGPAFTDVAVYRGTVGGTPLHQLYAAVDHLHWVVFDLTGTFDHQMPVLHHEGTAFQWTPLYGTTPVWLVRPTAGTEDWAGMARSLDIVEHPQGPMLAVTLSGPSYLKDYLRYSSEGIPYEADFTWGGGNTSLPGAPVQTHVYNIQDWINPQNVWEGRIDHGGQTVLLPEVQELGDTIKLVHNLTTVDPLDPTQRMPGMCLTLLDLLADPASGSFVAYPRQVEDAPGRLAFRLATSILDPDLLLVAGNDGGVPMDGVLATGIDPLGDYEIKVDYQPPVGELSDERTPNAHLFGAVSQWTNEPDQDAIPDDEQQFAFAEGRSPFIIQFAAVRHTFFKMHVPGKDAYANGVDLQGRWFFFPPKDRFQAKTQIIYLDGLVDRHFELAAGTTNLPTFANRQRTPDGLFWFDRTPIMTRIFDGTLPDGFDAKVDDLNWLLPNHLVTHPEFNNMPRDEDALRTYWQNAKTEGDDIGPVRSWAPRIVEVHQRGASDGFGAWVLVAPCGGIKAHPDWDIYNSSKGGDPAWKPTASIWTQNRTHGLVQFWELADQGAGVYAPVTTALGLPGDEVSGNSPLRKIVTPQPDANIWRVEALTLGDDVYLFCLDFGGGVYVYSIGHVLDEDDDPEADLDHLLVAEWQSEDCLIDDLPTALYDIAIEPGNLGAFVYVAARRVGIEALRFAATEAVYADRLTRIGRIQTSEYASCVQVRPLGGQHAGKHHVIVSDYGGGVRVYGEPETAQ